MNVSHRHLLTLLQQDFTTIEVVFSDNHKRYTYKARLDANIQEGDMVVVDSPHNGPTVVEVVAVHKVPKVHLDAPFTYKWIVQKVDFSAYRAQLEREEEFQDIMLEIERVRQREELIRSVTLEMPEGSKARALFDRARSLVNGSDIRSLSGE